MIAIVHSIYSQSVHAPALDAGLMDNDAERYCTSAAALWNTMPEELRNAVNVVHFKRLLKLHFVRLKTLSLLL